MHFTETASHFLWQFTTSTTFFFPLPGNPRLLTSTYNHGKRQRKVLAFFYPFFIPIKHQLKWQKSQVEQYSLWYLTHNLEKLKGSSNNNIKNAHVNNTRSLEGSAFMCWEWEAESYETITHMFFKESPVRKKINLVGFSSIPFSTFFFIFALCAAHYHTWAAAYQVHSHTYLHMMAPLN